MSACTAHVDVGGCRPILQGIASFKDTRPTASTRPLRDFEKRTNLHDKLAHPLARFMMVGWAMALPALQTAFVRHPTITAILRS